MTGKFTCSICRKETEGWSSNAAPFPGRCCETCNAGKVIPARIMRIRLGLDPRASLDTVKGAKS